jgi:hypothetical protein
MVLFFTPPIPAIIMPYYYKIVFHFPGGIMLLTNDGGIMELFAVAGTARGATNNTAITRAGAAQRAVPAVWFVKGIIPFFLENFPIKKF